MGNPVAWVAGWGAYGGAVGELKNSLPALMARRSHVGAHGHAVPQVPLSRDLVAMSADVGEEQKLLKMHYLCGSVTNGSVLFFFGGERNMIKLRKRTRSASRTRVHAYTLRREHRPSPRTVLSVIAILVVPLAW